MKIKSVKVIGKGDVKVEEMNLEPKEDEVLVKIARGGICGSDIHYFQQGGIGDFKLQHPMTLGHEVIGKIEKTGQAVAINPSKPCLECEYCLSGQSNQCLNMEFFGSAMRVPHVNGGFAQYVSVRQDQLVAYDEKISDEVMVFAEPLAVAIHAVNQSGGVLGKRVFISGCGPIGCLIAAASKAGGASEIVVSDLSERCQSIAIEMGADVAFSPSDGEMAGYLEGKGYFDISFEASGSIPAFQGDIDLTRAKGTLVLVGMRPGMVDFPLTKALAKELQIKGTFRFTSEFETAVRWLEKGLINPMPLLTKVFSFEDVVSALTLAEDKSKAMKVQLSFEE